MTANVENGTPTPKTNGNALYHYAGDSLLPPNYTIAWTASSGSFTESYAPTTTFMNVSEIDGGVQNFQVWAEAVDENAPPPSPIASLPASNTTEPSRPSLPPEPPLSGPGTPFPAR